MARYLVIVESPAKAHTIKKFLGNNYDVIASVGHVRDLPKSYLGIDVENDYEPKYITIRGKGDVLKEIRRKVKRVDHVYLATDPDREGEAISWHLMQALKLDEKNFSRVTFNEITKNVVKNSIKQARDIDMDLVYAQQTRRILDRIVGYMISPILWEKVKSGLSAGRVQSAVLRLVAEREKQINDFVPQEYWTLDADLLTADKKKLKVKYYGNGNKKAEISSKEQIDEIKKRIGQSDFVVSEVKRGERQRKAPLPFTTSTLQQEASKKLGMTTQKTMKIAQQLYEGVEIKGKGSVGLISYLRTDSTRISEEADAAAKQYVVDNYGKENVTTEVVSQDKKKKIQDAHEAIRPTYIDLPPTVVKESLSRDQFRLYQLIWKRFIASRMAPAVFETLSVKIDAGEDRFTASASKLVMNGFLNIYRFDDEKEEAEEDSDETEIDIASIKEGTKLALDAYEELQHFTTPPAHYTEASLVKTMEEIGIGRPSTYSPTITTILARRYVSKEEKNLYMTELGEVVDKMMTDAFPTIVDCDFTANLETLLDGIEEGTIQWKTVVRNFYPDFEQAVKDAEVKLEHVKIQDEVTDVICDKCGRNMVIKMGPFGKFLGCPGFPECRNTKTFVERIGVKCPECGAEMILKRSPKGRIFYGCERYPDCTYSTWTRPKSPENEKRD